MKKLFILAPFLASCQFLATNPAVDAEILSVGETIVDDVYEYETGKHLLPSIKIAVPAPTHEYKPPIQ